MRRLKEIKNEEVDDCEIIDQAIKYKNRAEFAQYSSWAYQAARRKGKEYLDVVCSHMEPTYYEKRKAFQTKSNTHPRYNLIAHKKEIKEIPKKSIMEFFKEESSGRYGQKIKEYSQKNNSQIKQMNQAQSNFVSVMGEKMSSTEITFLRFQQIVENAVKAMNDKNSQSMEILKTLIVMDNANFFSENIYEKNFSLLDENFNENEKNISIIFDISLKLSQMKNKNSEVDHALAMDELDHLMKNIGQYIEKDGVST